MSPAILKTKSYVKNGFADRIDKEENGLRELWNTAHIELRNIDSDLVMRCFAKAEYWWIEPGKWNDGKVSQYNIKLDSMSEAIKK